MRRISRARFPTIPTHPQRTAIDGYPRCLEDRTPRAAYDFPMAGSSIAAEDGWAKCRNNSAVRESGLSCRSLVFRSSIFWRDASLTPLKSSGVDSPPTRSLINFAVYSCPSSVGNNLIGRIAQDVLREQIKTCVNARWPNAPRRLSYQCRSQLRLGPGRVSLRRSSPSIR